MAFRGDAICGIPINILSGLLTDLYRNHTSTQIKGPQSTSPRLVHTFFFHWDPETRQQVLDQQAPTLMELSMERQKTV